jgi:putative peptidoglycan lipid II flippase
VSLFINAAVSLALYEPLGIGGIVIGTTVSNIALTLLEARRLRKELDGLEIARTLRAAGQMLVAAVVLGAIAYGTWYGLDQLLGRSLPAQIVSVGTALALGGAAYAAVLLRSGLPEARQVVDLFAARLRRGRG